jgi:PAS domain S-box-containing protein
MTMPGLLSYRSIRGKLFFVLSAWIILISVFIIGYFPAKLKSQSFESYVDKVKNIADMISYAVAPAMFFEDLTAVDDVFRTAQQNIDLVMIRLSNQDGRVVRLYERQTGLAALENPSPAAVLILESDGLIRIRRPVIQDKREIGRIDLVFSIKTIQKKIRDSQRTIALICLLFFGSGILAALAISALLTKPLRRLTETVESIIPGDLSRRARIDSGDEVGQLAISFNTMVDRLEQTQRELEGLNQGLERRVEERTLDLQREISERRRVEDQLRETNQTIQAIIDSSPLAICTLDPQARITSWSPAAERIFGWSRDEAVGRYNPIIPDGKTEEFEDFLSQVLSGLGFDQKEATRRTKEGQAIEVSISMAPLRDAQGKVVGALAVLEDITARKRTEKMMLETLKEKEVLLQEVHHRVKNNMQIISSMLRLQSSQIDDQNVREIFQSSQNRIHAMALVHEKLYVSKDLSRINFSDYIQSLAVHIFQLYQVNSDSIRLKTSLEDVFLDIQTAIPCALILNELISNALKYAFPNGRRGEIEIQMRTLDKRTHQLIVKDTGIGLPADMNIKNMESLGLNIVSMLVGQLDGSVEIRREGGTEFIIVFKEAHYVPRF